MSDPTPTVSIVTGAGSGIGKAIAQRLAKHGPVVLAGRRQAPLQEVASGLGDEGKDWLVVPTDISKGEDRTRLIDQTLAAFGRIDVLVNNAAIGTCGELGTLGEPDIEQLIDINLTAPILLTRLALQHLQKTSGCVVSIGSRAAIDPFPGLGTYGCTKAGLEAMARAIRNEYPQIRAYTVHPGAVETEMLRSIVSAEDLPGDQVLVPDDIAVAVESFVLGERPEPSGAAVVVAKN
ncbi:MAG: SDR family oxidoreductase [Phycisphaerales bacterium]|nr:SDR family oxidoreductase [Phycisphaerales bacterium]